MTAVSLRRRAQSAPLVCGHSTSYTRRNQSGGWRASLSRPRWTALLVFGGLMTMASSARAGPGEPTTAPSVQPGGDSIAQGAGLPPPKPKRPPKPGAPEGGPVDWFGAWQKIKDDLEQATGTSLNLSSSTQNQTIINGPGEHKNRTVSRWDVHLGQKLWPGGKAIVHARGGQGKGLDHLLGDRLNTDFWAGELRDLYITTYFLEQTFLDEKLLVRLGKLDWGDYFDDNAAGSWDFLSYGLARNPLIPVPWHAIGAMLKVDPHPLVYFQAGVFDAQAIATKTGFDTAFRGEDYATSIYELGLRPKFWDLQGNYRFLLWYDPQPLARIDGGGSKRDDLGFGLNFDQQVTQKITLFLRSGLGDEHVRAIDNYWSLGGAWTGPIAMRPDDVLSLGVGQGIMGRDFRDANLSTSAETIFETFYKIKVTEWCSVSPDIQVILHPGAVGSADVGVIAGVSLRLEF